jgi:hypothetical protein
MGGGEGRIDDSVFLVWPPHLLWNCNLIFLAATGGDVLAWRRSQCLFPVFLVAGSHLLLLQRVLNPFSLA